MLIFMVVACIVGHFADSLAPIFFSLGMSTIMYNNHLLVANTLLHLFRSMNFFVYYFSNKDFRDEFRCLFLPKYLQERFAENSSLYNSAGSVMGTTKSVNNNNNNTH